ncbi:hypothetical protein AMR72_04180 [Flavobacterium psychrophilum]|nr:hypothetical protein AMR72_04180 [Flavobacterium psychrophilum]AOE51782.1 hypothetical protein ALW18_04175 [Flavobacterium psychrophilum]
MGTAKIVWIIGSTCGIVVLCISLFVPYDTVLTITPTCYSVKQFGKECFMCGSTRSFLQLSAGNFKEGIALNRLAALLYLITAINTILFITYFTIINLKQQSK